MQIKLSRMGEAAYGDPEVLNSLGFAGQSLVLFWIARWKGEIDEGGRYWEFTLDPNKCYIIGCDEEDTAKLLCYRTHFAGSTIRSYFYRKPEELISRVFSTYRPEMSPNICYYSDDEYPHRDFALSCGILASFCFPLHAYTAGVLEIVSTRNQQLGVVTKFCESFQESGWSCIFQSKTVLQFANPELDRLLELLCQTFHLPLTQYWSDASSRLGHQFSCRDYENLVPWGQFKDACLHGLFYADEGPFRESSDAFFCKDITALSITEYPFAHYARNCGSIACFTIHFERYVLEFFLPSQEIDNDYTQTLLNSLWATLIKSLPNCKLSSGEQLGQVLSVKVINSSTQTEPEFFQIGQPQSSLPHYEGSGYTRTLKLFENGPDHRSSSNSYEDSATEETSKRIPEASLPRRSEIYFKTKGNTVAAERVDEPVEESTIEEAPYATSNVDVGCATSNVDIQNAMTTASQPSRFQTKKTLCQQEEETVFLENEGDTSQQLPRISQPLFEDGTEQDEQVLKIKKSTPNIYSYVEMSTAATSKRSPKYTEQIISLDELDEELPIKCNEPQSLTSQPRRSEEIFGNEGYTVASERVDNPVEVPTDEDVECDVTTASKRLKKSKIPCTAEIFGDEGYTVASERENISKHFGRPLKDAAESFGVSVSTFKRRCRDVGISRWPRGKSKIIDGEPGKKNFSSGMPNFQNRPVVTNASQDFTMTVKVAYNTDKIRFELPSSAGIAELENSVIERLPLKRKSFSLKYQDEEDDWILIACDKDVQECMKISRSLKKPTIKMLLGPPNNNYAP